MIERLTYGLNNPLNSTLYWIIKFLINVNWIGIKSKYRKSSQRKKYLKLCFRRFEYTEGFNILENEKLK